MKFIVGLKKEMTQQYREDGRVVPVTVVKVDRCVVTQIKSSEKDGYCAIQLGVASKKKAGKSMAGHLGQFTKANKSPFAKLQEIRLEDSSQFKVGDAIDVTMFEVGDVVSVTGTSKGKGFQGVVKRHGFHGSPASHGHKDQLRMPGSIGPQEPQRVFKGTRMAGRMGGDRVTVQNLEVVSIDQANNLLYVKGALPGARNSFVLLMGEGESKVANNVFEKPQTAVEPATEKKDEIVEDKKAEETSKEETVVKEAPKEEAKPESPSAEAAEDKKTKESSPAPISAEATEGKKATDDKETK